jgi:CRP-like cAMP-binding protein
MCDFQKNTIIATRPNLIYYVISGVIKITSTDGTDESHIGFFSNCPFEYLEHPLTTFIISAHTDVKAFWLYQHDLELSPFFRDQILQQFRYQNTRKQLYISVSGKRHTIERLQGFLELLAEDHGIDKNNMVEIPFQVTHETIASAIGATRVTVTRLMKQLCDDGVLKIDKLGNFDKIFMIKQKPKIQD